MPAAIIANQALAKAFDVLPDSWSFLVMQECFLGTDRFEEFLEELKIPRATLTARLKSLCKAGLMRKVAYSTRPTRHEYRLTDKGDALFPAFVALLSYGDTWLHRDAAAPQQLSHKSCRCQTEPLVVCSSCSRPVDARDVSYRRSVGMKGAHRISPRRARRTSDSAEFRRGRSSSFSRALHVVGDRWSGLILGEAFLGARKFDEFQARLHIGPNILTDRLTRFVTQGVFERLLYQSVPDRFEYRLTDMGLALLDFLILLMEWSDKWVAKSKRRAIILTHSVCNEDFTPRLICSHCSKPIVAGSVQYS